MISANLTEAETPSLLEEVGLAHGDNAVHVACVNSPNNVTLSGPVASVRILQNHLDQQGVFARTVNTGVAYHSKVRFFNIIVNSFDFTIWAAQE